MRKSIRFLLLVVTLITAPALATAQPAGSADETQALAEAVYIYGYPLVLMDVTKQVMTAVPAPAGEKMKAPINQFANIPAFPTPNDKSVVSPNADTLYSVAWLDLSQEPIILSLPDTAGRYYLMPLLDGWTNVFASPGARTTGTKQGAYAITGPHWQGDLPAGVKRIKAPTDMVWLIGRTKTDGPADFAAVNALQRQYQLIPLSAWGQDYTAPTDVPVDSKVDLKTPPVDQVNQMKATEFFARLAKLLEANPPAAADAPMVAKMKQLGLVAGKEFQPEPAQLAALEAGAKSGLKKIEQAAQTSSDLVNGWRIMLGLGQYGTHYLERAMVALIGLGANLSADAVYPMARVDAQGQAFDGANQYVLHFDKDAIPPVKGFWSLTLYNNQQFFVPNPLQRYAIGDRDPLQKNADGSIDLYIQNENPGPDKAANWLPAPKDGFNLIMRLYWPEKAVLNGTWKPPAVRKDSGS